MSYDYDLFTIGAGSGGVRASRMAARAGARVAVAEDRFLGGTCVNVGCVPKKLFVYASHFREELEMAEGFGWTVGERSFDWATLKAAKDKEIERLNGVYGHVLKGSGCDVLWGRATIVDAHTVEVATEEGPKRVTTENILVATGGKPRRPTIPGHELAWISDDVFYRDEFPERLMVVGGGYIAIEMACIFAGLGAKTTLVYRGSHLLRGFDDDVRSFVTDQVRHKGVDVRLNTNIDCLEKLDDGSIEVMLSHEEMLEVDAALYAIGRVPNTGDLGLEQVGVELNDKGAIVVDAHYRTSVPNIWALGDVTDRLNLTPVAIEEGIVLAHNLFGNGEMRTLDYDHVPTAVFSQPPVATVGLTEAQARDNGREVDCYTSEFRPMKRTLGGGQERTFMKIVADAKTDRVLGVHIVGESGPEIIQGFAVALKCGATKAQLDATVGLHPTAAEELVTMREKRP